MALTTLGPEMKIKNGLRLLNCAESNFAKISGVVGKSRMAEGLSEDPRTQKAFDRPDAERMLAVLGEMQELQAAVGDIPVDWSRVDKMRTALVVRRVARIAAELHIEDTGLQETAAQVMQQVKGQSASAAQNQ